MFFFLNSYLSERTSIDRYKSFYASKNKQTSTRLWEVLIPYRFLLNLILPFLALLLSLDLRQTKVILPLR